MTSEPAYSIYSAARIIEKLESRYDPDNDLVSDAIVTWADAQLLLLIQDLYARLESNPLRGTGLPLLVVGL